MCVTLHFIDQQKATSVFLSMHRTVEGIAICSTCPGLAFKFNSLVLVSNSAPLAAASEAVADELMTGSNQKGLLAKMVYGAFFN